MVAKKKWKFKCQTRTNERTEWNEMDEKTKIYLQQKKRNHTEMKECVFYNTFDDAPSARSMRRFNKHDVTFSISTHFPGKIKNAELNFEKAKSYVCDVYIMVELCLSFCKRVPSVHLPFAIHPTYRYIYNKQNNMHNVNGYLNRFNVVDTRSPPTPHHHIFVYLFETYETKKSSCTTTNNNIHATKTE